MNTAISHLCFTQPPTPLKKMQHTISSGVQWRGEIPACQQAQNCIHLPLIHKNCPHSQIPSSFTNFSLIHKLLPHSQITPSFTKFTAMIFCFPLFKFINLGLPHFGQIWDCSDVQTGAVRTRTTPRLPRHLAYSSFLNWCDMQPDKSKNLMQP